MFDWWVKPGNIDGERGDKSDWLYLDTLNIGVLLFHRDSVVSCPMSLGLKIYMYTETDSGQWLSGLELVTLSMCHGIQV